MNPQIKEENMHNQENNIFIEKQVPVQPVPPVAVPPVAVLPVAVPPVAVPPVAVQPVAVQPVAVPPVAVPPVAVPPVAVPPVAVQPVAVPPVELTTGEQDSSVTNTQVLSGTEVDKPNPVISLPEPITYKYIDDDQLNKMFGFCMNTQDTTYNIHFAMFSINTKCFIEGTYEESEYTEELSDIQSKYNERYPFLQFFMNKEDDMYSFPIIQYQCPVIKESTDFSQDNGEPIVEEKSQEQIHFETECFKYLFSILQDESQIHEQQLDISSLYKGFLEKDETNLFVFFDITSLISKLKPGFTIAIIDEIVYKKIIYSTPVNEIVTNFFKQNKQLCSIKTIDDKIYPFPFQLYSCKFTDEYENISIESPEKYPSYEHSFFGIAYYFTTLPIINSNVETLKRYACFIINGLYIKGDINELQEEEREEYQKQILPASTIYFHENNLQLWGIKNISQFIEY